MRDIRTIGIAGTGLMGGDTAALCAGNGYNVIMMGISEEECQKGLANVRADYNELVREKLMSRAQADEALSRVSALTGFEHGGKADFIFEAVLEREDVKREVYRQLEAVCESGVVFASITSGLSPNSLAESLKHKERLLVAHFWNPAHLIPLVEVVRGKATSDEATDATLSVLRRLKKEIVLIDKDVPGFIGNRLMHAMYREALHLVESGVCSPEDIDRTVLNSFGPRFSSVGLLEYYDSCGLDLQHNVQSYLFESLCAASRPQRVLTERCERGDLGPKTGQGIFDWSKKDMADFRRRKSKPFYKMFSWNLTGEEE